MGSKVRSSVLLWNSVPSVTRRTLSYTTTLSSGHNRWSKIRHDKAKDDAAKCKERSILSQDVMLASKFGGSDPNLNPRLGIAIANAKRGHLPKTSIDAAIAKGQGKSLNGAPLENVTIEAMMPHGVAVIIEYLTDSKGRLLQEQRAAIHKGGGIVTPTAFLFDKKGKIWFEPKEGIGVDEALEGAIEAGADDINMDERMITVETAPSELTLVGERIQETLGLQIHKSEILFAPKAESVVDLAEHQQTEVQRILDSLEDEPNLQAIYINART